jgi:DNA-binding IclR family transcriptional regulator
MSDRYRNPAVERTMDILRCLEGRVHGANLNELAAQTAVARSTVYRILNSLEAHGMVRRQGEGGRYLLGPRLLRLATHVTAPSGGIDLAAVAQPHLERLARQTGETSKVSVYDRGSVLVLAGVPGSGEHALHIAVGQHLPIHAGAASKMLLAYQPQAERDRILAMPLKPFTERTIVDPAKLLKELHKVRRQGWSHDPGEFSISIRSFGAPILDAEAQLVGALSIPFLIGRGRAFDKEMQQATIEGAIAISVDVRG